MHCHDKKTQRLTQTVKHTSTLPSQLLKMFKCDGCDFQIKKSRNSVYMFISIADTMHMYIRVLQLTNGKQRNPEYIIIVLLCLLQMSYPHNLVYCNVHLIAIVAINQWKMKKSRIHIYMSIADALHAYFGVCGMSLMGEPGILSMHTALNISQRAANNLTHIHRKWRDAS